MTEEHLANHKADNAGARAAALCVFGVPTFGEVISAKRRVHDASPEVIAAKAGLSVAYYAALETCQRLAPPRSTVLCIARALRMTKIESGHLVLLAEAERAAALQSAHLPPRVRRLVLIVQEFAPRLPEDLLDSIELQLTLGSR